MPKELMDLMLSTHCTAMREVRFPLRSFSMTVTQSKLKDLLSLSTEDGFQLTLEIRNIDQPRSTPGSSSRLEEFSELVKIFMTTRFQTTLIITNGTTLPSRTLVFSGISPTGMRPNITTSKQLILRTAQTVSKLNLVSKQLVRINLWKSTTAGDGMKALMEQSRRPSELLVQDFSPSLTSPCETNTSI